MGIFIIMCVDFMEIFVYFRIFEYMVLFVFFVIFDFIVLMVILLFGLDKIIKDLIYFVGM